MALPIWSTFDYVATVPDRLVDDSSPWVARLREPVQRTSDGLGSRLVGASPRLQITDAGLTPNPGYTRGVWRPEVLRSRITLIASEMEGASARSVSFHVDKGLTSALRPGDLIYTARTGCAQLGLSVVRHGQLVVAVGAITAVPLGKNAEAQIPWDLVEQMEAMFRKRDPHFSLSELPIEVRVGNRRLLSLGRGGRSGLKGYVVKVMHGFYRGMPGVDECAAISLIGACSDIAADSSALLLDTDPYEIIGW